MPFGKIFVLAKDILGLWLLRVRQAVLGKYCLHNIRNFFSVTNTKALEAWVESCAKMDVLPAEGKAAPSGLKGSEVARARAGR